MFASPASHKAGTLFAGADQDPFKKQLRLSNPEYIAAFDALDVSRSGWIGMQELGLALLKVQNSVESVRPGWNRARQFNSVTCCWLSAKFGGAQTGFRLNKLQFCELLDYIQGVRTIFSQVDTGRTGAIDCAELHRAFQLSRISVPADIIAQIGQCYDADGTGRLEFDEFVQMHMEWSSFIDAWDTVARGAASIAPAQLLGILEGMRSCLYQVVNGQVLTPARFSMSTCCWLVAKFGVRTPNQELPQSLTYDGFLLVVHFLKVSSARFLRAFPAGAVPAAQLPMALAQFGVSFGAAPAQGVTGSVDFDQFILILIQCQLYDFAAGRRPPSPTLAPQPQPGQSGLGTLVLTPSGLLAART